MTFLQITQLHDQATPSRALKVALITMPWAHTDTPSIQCGLLKAEASQYGHDVDVCYLNLELAALLGPRLYSAVPEVSSGREDLFGEWLFGASVYLDSPEAADYFSHFPDLRESLSRYEISQNDVSRLRDEVLPEWIADQARQIANSGYEVVGFSSMFEQNVASFALARHLKKLSPDLVTVFGGANFDGEMGPEYLRVLPFIDYAVIGEGDLAFPALLASVADRRPPTAIPGVWGRSTDGSVIGGGTAPVVQDMDTVPAPDFDDYFAALGRLGRAKVLVHPERLVAETSRGCWWGEKHHCTFCGLNALGMTFRAKSPDRALGELTELTRKYQVNVVHMTDNILDMGYLTTLCKRLTEEPWDPSLFYEIKANLTRHQVRLLRQAGVERIQAGIESLSTHVLGLMRKGTTMLINVSLLKWARLYGTRVAWNMIMGFPGERDQDYEEQADLIPSLYHLEPPDGAGHVWLERFSPYYTGDFPIRDIRPRDAYGFVYPIDGIDLNRIAYFFDYQADDIASANVHGQLEKAVESWREQWKSGRPPVLSYTRGPGWLAIKDTRSGQRQRITMSGWKAEVYQYCEEKSHSNETIGEFIRDRPQAPSDDDLTGFLRRCLDTRIMVSDGGRYLSLALPVREVLSRKKSDPENLRGGDF